MLGSIRKVIISALKNPGHRFEERLRLSKLIASLGLKHDDLIRRHNTSYRQIAHIERSEVACDDVTTMRQYESYPIIITTLPKSGSIFILKNLEIIFRKPYLRIGPGYFPDENIDMFHLQELVTTAGVSQSHFPASPANIRLLSKTVKNVWIHFRDPRSATLSWAHHVTTLRDHSLALAAVRPELPMDYFQWHFDRQLSWQIENYLPLTVAWMREWQNTVDSGTSDLRLLITTFEEMVKDPVAFMVRAGSWHGLEMGGLDRLPVEKSEGNHFRKGQTDEWMTAFSGNDRRVAARLIDEDLAERYGWVNI